MKKIRNKPFYPENIYCVVFGKSDFPKLPSDAEETLEYLMGTLSQSEGIHQLRGYLYAFVDINLILSHDAGMMLSDFMKNIAKEVKVKNIKEGK